MDKYVEALRDHADEQDQMVHQHVLMVNRDPILLDLVRVMLDNAHYNVTTTNAVPRTFALIAAARPSLIIIDLEITQQSGWDLLVRLHTEVQTTGIPVIVTARDVRLLAHAHRYPYLFGGKIHLSIPFSVATLLDAVQRLIGAVATMPGDAQGDSTPADRKATPRDQSERRDKHSAHLVAPEAPPAPLAGIIPEQVSAVSGTGDADDAVVYPSLGTT